MIFPKKMIWGGEFWPNQWICPLKGSSGWYYSKKEVTKDILVVSWPDPFLYPLSLLFLSIMMWNAGGSREQSRRYYAWLAWLTGGLTLLLPSSSFPTKWESQRTNWLGMQSLLQCAVFTPKARNPRKNNDLQAPLSLIAVSHNQRNTRNVVSKLCLRLMTEMDLRKMWLY